MTSLAILALMSDGSSPRIGRKKKQESLRAALTWILKKAGETKGYVRAHDATGIAFPMYGHALAVLMLSQVHGEIRFRSRKIRNELEETTRFLEKKQRSNGGWGMKRPNMGVTGTVYQALRAADSNGISLKHANLDKTISFVRKSYVDGGGFGMSPRSTTEKRLFWTTSSGLRILLGTGETEKSRKMINRSINRIRGRKLGADYKGKTSEWDYAGLLTVVQAFIHRKGEDYRFWYPRIRKQLLDLQNPDGSWEIEYCKKCRAFATSMAVIFLRAPNLLLPIFQK